MKAIVLDFRTALENPRYAIVLRDYLVIRKSVFVDHLHWEISSNNGLEIDQYDSAYAHYIIMVDESYNVLSGCRINPIAAKHQSFMIEDLWPYFLPLVKLDGSEWECTRFVVASEISARQGLLATKFLIAATVKWCSSNGIESILGVSHSGVHNQFIKCGCILDFLGKVVGSDDYNLIRCQTSSSDYKRVNTKLGFDVHINDASFQNGFDKVA